MHPKNIRKGKGTTSYRFYTSDSCRPTSPEKTARNEGITNPTHFDIKIGFPPLGSVGNPRQPRVGPQVTRPPVGPSNASGTGSRPVSPALVATSPKNHHTAAVGPTPKDDSSMESPTAAATNNGSGWPPVSSERATTSPKNPSSSASAAVGASPNDDSTQNLVLTAAASPDGSGSRPVSPPQVTRSTKNRPSSEVAAVGPTPKDDSMETPTPAAIHNVPGSPPVSSERATSAMAAVGASPNDDSTQNLKLTAAAPPDIGSGSRPVSLQQVTRSPKNRPSSAMEAVDPSSPKDDSMETPTDATNNGSGLRPVSSEQATKSPKNPPSSATAAVGASPNDDSIQNIKLTVAAPPDIGSGSRPVSPQQVARSPKKWPSSAMEDGDPSPNDDSIKNLGTPAAAPTNGSGSLRQTSPDLFPVAAAPELSLRMNEWNKFTSIIQGGASSHTNGCGDRNAMHPAMEPEFPDEHVLHEHLTPPAVPTSNDRSAVLPTPSNSAGSITSANNLPAWEGPASQTSLAATLTRLWRCEDIMDPGRPGPPPVIVPMPSQRLLGSTSAGSASSRQFMVVAMGPGHLELLVEALSVLEGWLAATGLGWWPLTVKGLAGGHGRGTWTISGYAIRRKFRPAAICSSGAQGAGSWFPCGRQEGGSTLVAWWPSG